MSYMALDGNDGLDLIKKIIYKSKYIFKTKGTLALEIGNEQINKVSKYYLIKNIELDKLSKIIKTMLDV